MYAFGAASSATRNKQPKGPHESSAASAWLALPPQPPGRGRPQAFRNPMLYLRLSEPPGREGAGRNLAWADEEIIPGTEASFPGESLGDECDSPRVSSSQGPDFPEPLRSHLEVVDLHTTRPRVVGSQAGYAGAIPFGDFKVAPYTPPPPPPSVDGRQLPLDHLGEPSSVGSIRHNFGECIPCLYWFQATCGNGAACTYCHLLHPGQRKKRIRPSRQIRVEMAEKNKRKEGSEPNDIVKGVVAQDSSCVSAGGRG